MDTVVAEAPAKVQSHMRKTGQKLVDIVTVEVLLVGLKLVYLVVVPVDSLADLVPRMAKRMSMALT